MIKFIKGNLLESNAEALVNTVNTEGIMGKGIALQFRNMFPINYKLYVKACRNNEIKIGKLFVTEEQTLLNGSKIIINFPTKKSWKLPSEYRYIEEGLKELVNIINIRKIKSIAIPPLGSGNGGLDWNRVKIMIDQYLNNIECDIEIYEPNSTILETLKKERVKLTPARAMLLSVLFDLVRNGEFVSEFASEKIAYFLQRFGAKEVFNLNFEPNYYGPYSGKVKHVLYYLNGSYIMGFSSKNAKPFEELNIVQDAEPDINHFLALDENKKFKLIVEKTIQFLTGFYSSFGLELLSTVDFIMLNKQINSSDEILREISNWSDRKKSIFNNPKYIDLAVNHITKNLS
jgi:O-acetyl-ADP-ribose deacetylase (regulator of RNase III)/uncharacterized protein YwgA